MGLADTAVSAASVEFLASVEFQASQDILDRGYLVTQDTVVSADSADFLEYQDFRASADTLAIQALDYRASQGTQVSAGSAVSLA